jgi:hypothetical protein
VERLRRLKIGDTLDLRWSLPIAFGSTVDTVTSSIKTEAGVAVCDLTVTDETPSATHTIWRLYAAPAVTVLWPVGTLVCDIKHVIGTDVVRSDTFEIPVGEAVTP